MPDLIVMESATKCKKVQQYLGSGYTCISSKGHVIDLPKNKFGVKIDQDFTPTYEVLADKRPILKEIITLAKDANIVYLMADPDREGEAIAWHLSRSLPKGTVFKRATTNSITKDAIQAAIANAGNLDTDLINAYECRRILDRLVGYKCSYPVKMATGGISVGRTQTAGLRILGERELEIKTFIPEEFWTIEGVLLSKKSEPVVVEIKKPKPLEIKAVTLAEEILTHFKNNQIIVAKYENKIAQTKPSAPFRTSTLQQAASTYLGMSPKRAMIAAQKLYESGNITYHRTDSLNIISSELFKIRQYIKDSFEDKYQTSQINVYDNKVKNAQEAHEAIRPTDVSKPSINEDTDEARLYQLIWKRTVASQMASAHFARRSAAFIASNKEDYVLGANGSKLIFDGFKKVWDYGKNEDTYLPDLTEGEIVTIRQLDKIRKETSPPARYSEASFVKALETTGVGRPSTYQAIIETLKAREYITVENRSITVTALGLCVMQFCLRVDFCFIDLQFTAKMEELLDGISNKQKEKLSTLKDFWVRLQQDLENCKRLTMENSKTDYKCPQCKKELTKKHSNYGAFFGCSGYPECKYTAQIGPTGEPQEKVKKEKKPVLLSQYDCPVCKKVKMIKRTGQYGDFYGCSSYPKCKGILDKDGKPPEPKWKKKDKKYSKPPKPDSSKVEKQQPASEENFSDDSYDENDPF